MRSLGEAERLRWREVERTLGVSERKRRSVRPEPPSSRAYKAWTVSELSVALDQSLDNRQVAELTKRSVVAVRQMRQRIARYL